MPVAAAISIRKLTKDSFCLKCDKHLKKKKNHVKLFRDQLSHNLILVLPFSCNRCVCRVTDHYILQGLVTLPVFLLIFKTTRAIQT